MDLYTGKAHHRLKDITGEKFGKLTVIGRAKDNAVCGQTRWVCKCECGNETVVQKGHLTTGNTQSCGCYGNQKRLNIRRPGRRLITVGRQTKTLIDWSKSTGISPKTIRMRIERGWTTLDAVTRPVRKKLA